MRVLVTGADGFVGDYLVKELQSHGHRVLQGLQRRDDGSPDGPDNIRFDLGDAASVTALVEEAQPDGIVHLAAQSSVQDSWKNPATTMEINLMGTLRLLEAIVRVAPKARVITVGSGEEYGWTAREGAPLRETDPCQPMNPYAVSKYAVGLTGGQIALRGRLDHFHVRSFNHYGPGQREGFVVSDFASRIARIEAVLQPPVMSVGNLLAKRDFTHVMDVVRAYRLLLEADAEPGIYNVCSGRAVMIQTVLDHLIQQARVPVETQVDPALNRPAEIPVFVGCPDKLRQATQWEPEKDLSEGLMETMNGWRDRYSAKTQKSR